MINTTIYQERPFFYSGNSTEWLSTSSFYDSLSFVSYPSSDIDEFIKSQYHGVPTVCQIILFFYVNFNICIRQEDFNLMVWERTTIPYHPQQNIDSILMRLFSTLSLVKLT